MEKSRQQLADEREEAAWREKHGPMLEANHERAQFQLLLAEGKVPYPYAKAREMRELFKIANRGYYCTLCGILGCQLDYEEYEDHMCPNCMGAVLQPVRLIDEESVHAVLGEEGL